MSETFDNGLDTQTLVDYFRKIENAINEFCNLDTFPETLDLCKAGPQQFSACMQYVGKTVFVKPIPGSNRNRTIVDLTNTTLLYGLLDYYIYICNLYNKVPTMTAYSYMIGISLNTLYDWNDMYRYSSNYKQNVGYSKIAEEITLARSRLVKIINKLHEQTLLDRLSNNNNPIGMIAAGNVVHNWDNRRTETNQDAQQIESNVISAKYLLSDSQDAETRQIVSDANTIPDFTGNDLQ